jgi:glycosyltransferase involved in cell wall biosynthesis
VKRTFTVFSTHNREPRGQLLRRKLRDSSIKRHALENNWGGPRIERVKSRDPFPEFEQWREKIWHTALNYLNEKTSPSPWFFAAPIPFTYFSIYLFLYLFICLFCLVDYLFIFSRFIFLLLYLFIYFYSSGSLFIHSFIYLFIYLPVYFSTSLFVYIFLFVR